MWSFGSLINDSPNLMLVDYAISPGSVTTGAALNGARGNAILVLDTVGGIYFTDMGVDGTTGQNLLQIQYLDTAVLWRYTQALVVDAAIEQDGSFVLKGEGTDLVLSGNLSTNSDLSMMASAQAPSPISAED